MLKTPEALKHTHHFIVHSCKAPEGSTAEDTFEKFIGEPGGLCFNSPNTTVPYTLCQSYLYVWAIGGKV